MHRRLKTCCALMPPLALRLIQRPAILILAIILLGSTTLSQSDSGRPGVSANELARKVVTNELKFQTEDLGHWMYRLEKEESGRKQVQVVVETKDGSLSRLLSIEGRPLNAKQQLKEDQRIQKLVSNPAEQRKFSRPAAGNRSKGSDCSRFWRMYSYWSGSASKIGLASGPMLASPIVGSGNYSGVIMLALVLLTCSMLAAAKPSWLPDHGTVGFAQPERSRCPIRLALTSWVAIPCKRMRISGPRY